MEEYYCNICEEDTKHIEFKCSECGCSHTLCIECGY